MSRCRCVDMREQERLISTLESAWDGLSDANGSISTARTSTEEILMLYPQSSIQVKLQNSVSYFADMMGDLGSVRGRIDGSISSTLSELHRELEDMIEEDDEFHEEEDEEDDDDVPVVVNDPNLLLSN